jgi:hypothetical protein
VSVDLGVDAPIGNDFHSAIGEQEIDQQAVPVLGIPYPTLRKDLQCPLSRRLFFDKGRAVQR